MKKLDPQLEFLAEGGVDIVQETNSVVEAQRYGIHFPATEPSAASPAPPQVEILVQFASDPAELEDVGMTVHSMAGDVVSGSIGIDRVAELAEIAAVDRVESSRAMYPELDLAVVDTNVDDVHMGPPGRRGSGVIVGIVDSGCDYTHPSFLKPDGTSRIQLIWDQGLARQAGEANPAAFNYGVEYGNSQINAALQAADPFAVVRHRVGSGDHGTHVSGIAVGDGSAAGQGRPSGTFVGVAPEADIIVVAAASNGNEGLGTSANTLDAVNYIFQRAQALGRPAVINMSLGDNLGPHDGTSLLERGLDNLLGAPGRAFVKSAGNAGADGIHAEGTVGTGATVDVLFNQPTADTSPNQIDLWYEGADTFRVSVVDPGGNVVGPVSVGTASTFALPGGNSVRVDHRDNDAFNGDKRVFFTFTVGAAAQMATGNWRIRLRSVTSPSGGRFDAWIQRGPVIPRFLAPHENSARTISTPGTATEIITAASYVTRGAGVGSLSTFSSRGPTRDGRQAPTVAAPGQSIISARSEFGSSDPYVPMSGTSMAAPHVTGVIALMLQRTPTLTAAEIAARIRSSARSDAFTGPVPNTAWGAGKIDAFAAVQGALIGPVSVPAVRCPSVAVTTCPVSVPVVRCPSVVLTRCVLSVPVVRCPSVVAVTCPVASVPGVCGFEPTVIRTVVVNPAVNNPAVNAGLALSQSIDSDMSTNPVTDGAVNAWDARGVAGDSAEHQDDSRMEQPPLPEQGFYDYDETWFD